MISPLRVIVIGLGQRGQQWLEITQKCDNVEVVAGIDPDRSAAERFHGRHVVRHKQDRTFAAPEFVHLPEAFLLERCVADGENLVNEQYVRIQVRGHGKAEPQAHAG